MKRRTFWRWACVFALLLAAVPAGTAWAVAPAVLPVVQALAVILPQILALLAAAAMAVLKPKTYKVLFKYLWSHKLFTVGAAAFICLAVWGFGKLGFGRGAIGQEQVGAAWPAMRGTPERIGAVPGARGPQKAAKIAWSSKVANFERIDSCPAVVGNRVYFSSGILSIYTKNTTGVLYCYDTEKGGEVWRWKGEGLKPGLMGIYSSPVVGGKFRDLPKKPDGTFQEGKYLAIGEGYHLDFNGRILCLDLEPVKTGKEKTPKLLWNRQTTCHVESTPCIFGDEEERVYIGAADDGLWCLRLSDGEVLWHIEGTPAYYVEEGPKAAELEKLAGKIVAASGKVERQGATAEEAGWVLLTVSDFREVAAEIKLKPDIGDGFKRTVKGKVVVADAPPKMPKGASRVSIEPLVVAVDCESAPIVVKLPEPKPELKDKVPAPDRLKRVYIGTGLGGPGIVCADADTGAIIWRQQMPYPVFSAPTVAGDKVIVGMGVGDVINNQGPGVTGEIRCFSAYDGKELWKVKADATILGAVGVGDGVAYAAACDRKLYIIDMDKEPGKLLGTFPVDAAMVAGPTVTDDAVYLATNSGRVFCMDRQTRAKRWVRSLGASQGICSSPAVAAGRLFVGTVDRGFVCLVEDTAEKKAEPWTGPGGNLARDGAADDQGLPTISGDRALVKWVDAEKKAVYPLRDRTMDGPVAACGNWLYLAIRAEPRTEANEGAPEKPLLARVDFANGKEAWTRDLNGPISALAADERHVYALVGPKGEAQKAVCLEAASGEAVWGLTPGLAGGVLTLGGGHLLVAPKSGGLVLLNAGSGAELWKRDVGEVVGSPIAAWGLIMAIVGGANPKLLCLDDADGREIWSAALPGKPSGPPTVSGNRIFAACEGKEAGKGTLLCRQLADGGEVWTKDLPEAPFGYPVAKDDLVAVAGVAGKLYALAAADGKFLREDGLVVGESLLPPALVQGTLVFAGKNRVGTWVPAASSWPWSFRDQGIIGRPLAPPLVARETVFVVSERRGLVAIGARPEDKDKAQKADKGKEGAGK